MNDTVPTHEMIQNLAEYIVNGMLCQELAQHVYEDIYCTVIVTSSSQCVFVRHAATSNRP